MVTVYFFTRIPYPEIQPRLANLLKKGYKVRTNKAVLWKSTASIVLMGLTCLNIPLQVVFFTNQLGIARGKLRPEVFKSKVEDVLATLKLPVQVGKVLHHRVLHRAAAPHPCPFHVSGVCSQRSWCLQETRDGNVESPV